MLAELLPRGHARLTALPLLGPVVSTFAVWLRSQGYPDLPIRLRLRAIPRLEARLRRRGVRLLTNVPAAQVRACAPRRAGPNDHLSALVHSLESFLDQHGLLAPASQTASEGLVAVYREHLKQVRGFAASTLKNHGDTASSLLAFIKFDRHRATLRRLDPRRIEAFLVATATHRTRATLQQSVAHLRSFLRFLASRGDVVPGLDASIDTPRLYRGEQFPRALAWDIVQALLAAIDRSTPRGRRDYAMLLLLATYGLRVSEVAALRLDDIAWRAERIRVPRPKVSLPLELPLTVEVGAALVDYVQHGRPKASDREVFLGLRAPVGPLGPTAISEAFQRWKRRSGLPIGDHSAHCLRHSLAIHLLRQGTALKTIGDLLGHRSVESTCVYLRLHVADLREAALDLPREDLR